MGWQQFVSKKFSACRGKPVSPTLGLSAPSEQINSHCNVISPPGSLYGGAEQFETQANPRGKKHLGSSHLAQQYISEAFVIIIRTC